MSWEDEDIDKLFRESANQVNVPFQESFWDEMEAMLPQKKKKKGFFWIFGASFTVITAVIAGTFLFPTQRPVSTTIHSVSTSNSTPASVSTVSPITETTILKTSNATETTVADKSQRSKLNLNDLTTRFYNRASKSTIFSDGALLASNSTETGSVISTSSNPIIPQNTKNQEETDIRLPFRSFSTSIGLQPSKSFEMQLKSRKNNPWFVQLNVGISQAYLREASTVSPTLSIGIGYQKRMANIAFSAGLQAQNMFINSLEITRTSRVYNFASTNYKQEIQIKQLYTVEIPLAVTYVKNRHSFSLGITPGYLLTSIVKVREFENDVLQQQNNYVGQRIGMKSFSLKPTLGYQLAINKAWQVGIQVQTQLFGQLDKTQFAGEERKLPLIGQLIIRKTLFNQ